MRSSVTGFIEHAHLPFVGRGAELDRIVTFWRGTIDGPGLRSLLLAGEAGIGKSRLTEEACGVVEAAGGLVISARLFPGGGVDLGQALADALGSSSASRRLLVAPPLPTIPAVVSSLRRVARLRPTLLVIEDLHLLENETAALTALQTLLADEHLSLLGTSRPVEGGWRAILERSMTGEIDLQPLDRNGVSAIWRAIFGEEPESAWSDLLTAVTRGNPLALRSVLRGGINGGGIRLDGEEGPTVDLRRLTAIAHRCVARLGEGLAAPLSSDLLRRGERLSLLGELFARETAVAMLDDEQKHLDRLIAHGIVVVAGVDASPLAGDASRYPLLRFCHTLLHAQLATQASPSGEALARLVARGLPIHALDPLLEVANWITRGEAPAPGEPLELMERLGESARRVDATRDWQRARDLWQAARLLLDRSEGLIDARRYLHARVELAIDDLGLARREQHTPEFARAAEEALQLCEPLDEHLAARRISLLRIHLWLEFRSNGRLEPRTFAEVDEILHDHPPLSRGVRYREFLRDAVQISVAIGREEMIRDVERRLDSLLADPLVTPEEREQLLRDVASHLLPLFGSHEELARRRAFAEQLARSGPLPISIQLSRIRMHEEAGEYRDVLRLAERLEAQIEEVGIAISLMTCRVLQVTARYALGEEWEQIWTEAVELYEGAAVEHRERLALEIGVRLFAVALLLDDPAARERLRATFPTALAAWPLLGELDIALRGESPSRGGVVNGSDHLVTDPVGTTSLLEALLRLEEARGNGDHSAQQRRGVTALLEWLAARRLHFMLRSLLRRYAGIYSTAARSEWERMSRSDEEKVRTRPRVRVIGQLSIERREGDWTMVRRGRVRTLLGLLVADRLRKEALPLEALQEIVVGGEGLPPVDHDALRKGTNLAVHRLRELLGHDAVLTVEGRPMLSQDVEVDLFATDRAMAEARQGLRDRHPAKACTCLHRVLEGLGGEVVFPGLYHPFFESLRDDHEAELRSLVLATARLLREEGDEEGARELMAHGARALPGDDELEEARSSLNSVHQRTFAGFSRSADGTNA